MNIFIIRIRRQNLKKNNSIINYNSKLKICEFYTAKLRHNEEDLNNNSYQVS